MPFRFTVKHHVATCVVAFAILVGDGIALLTVHPRTRGDASTPTAAINRAVYDLDHYDLPHFCSDFAPGAIAGVAELFGTTNCSDSRLTWVHNHCPVCRKADRAYGITVEQQSSGEATVRLVVRDDEHAVMSVPKVIHLVRAHGEWLLESSPEATQ
jgi:hypothetical protein